ncbi:MAG: response regulator [Deltaproteobacteria bacterium]|nr:response regulator [Deltaproteobacteria bacterium]
MPKRITPDTLLRSSEVSALVGVHANSVVNWTAKGYLPSQLTPGGHRRVLASDLIQFLRARNMRLPRVLERMTRAKVLVVDDDVPLLRAMRRWFSPFEAVVDFRVASTVFDALLEIANFSPDLVVVDYFMPQFDGITLCKHIKRRPGLAHIDVILMTGQLTAAIRKRAVDAGVMVCIEKPLDRGLLFDALGIRGTARPAQ